ncbi:40S ribosomal protein S9, mitochondrial precursor [Microthyrium microscopicum]|uniref:Small ribosomal subunit protein uS9m n=1 Tax=Microthyrium microscopicum TaxID=703497 RepID=A0A6A6U3J9_9PEZI|nr:40S ribosomal protein S9, mitochondrial precursor [Microthyrium microscopicum]
MVRYALVHSIRNAASLATTPSRSISRLPIIRPFSTSRILALEQQEGKQLLTIQPPLDIEYEDVEDHPKPLLERVRIVPDSQSYFSARPSFTDTFLGVEHLYLKWKVLPRTATPQDTHWTSYDEVRAMTGNEPVPEKRYREMIRMLKDLDNIEPVVMPTEVLRLIDEHKRAFQPNQVKPKVFLVDEWGRSLGVGKRKTSTAKAYLVMGEGEVLVNGKSLTEYFGRLHDRESALWALKITERIPKYNIFALVEGGGVTGQAEALTLAISRALLVHEPQLEHRLLEAGCLFRDPRKVERKKPGHLKARKMPAWVRR